MTLTTYFLYLAAVALLVLSPGPTMLMCMTTALNHGPRKAMTSAAGSVSAVLCVMLLSALGLGALLAASETAFTVAKFMGAAYLIWLGVKTFRSDAAVLEAQPRERHQRSEGPPRASDGPRGAGARGSEPACAGLDGRQRRSVSRAAACKASGATRSARPWGQYFLRGFLVGASNPKAVLFFAAFFPQFLNPAAPFVPQFAILALTFMAFELTVLTLCALGVSRVAPLLRSSGPVRWFNRVSGGLFTLMGGHLLLTRRHT